MTMMAIHPRQHASVRIFMLKFKMHMYSLYTPASVGTSVSLCLVLHIGDAKNWWPRGIVSAHMTKAIHKVM